MVDFTIAFPRGLSLGVALGAFAWSTVASAAAPAPSADGRRFRLHADTDFFGYTHIDDEGPGPDADDVNIVGFGFGRPTLTDSQVCAGAVGGCALGVRPLFGIGFGYAIVPNNAILGVRFSFTVDGAFVDNDDEGHVTLVGGQFVPYFHWMFIPGSQFRPYVEGRFGLGGGASVSTVHPPDTPDFKSTTNIIYPTVGVGGGMHIFIIDALSFDAGLNFDFLAPHGRTVTDPDLDPMTDDEDYEPMANVFNLAVMAGFSVWIP